MAKKNVVLSVGADDIEFEVTSENYNRFINETKPEDKVLPAKRFLRRSLVDADQRELLDELCDRGQHLVMAGMLIEEFSGELEIEVKK